MSMEKCLYRSPAHLGETLAYYQYDSGTPGKKPLLIYLHGAGSCGDTLEKMSRVGPLARYDSGLMPDCVMVAPQCAGVSWLEVFEMLLEFIDFFRHDPRIDPERVYLTGISMGAYASWLVLGVRPDWFTAAVLVCGGGIPFTGKKMTDIAVWAFHGARDTVVVPEESLTMIRHINAAGGNARLTIIPEAGHDAWTYTYSNEEMWKWLFEQTCSLKR